MRDVTIRPGLTLPQKDGLFPLGQDSVLLAAFAAPKAGSRGLDIGAGQGFLSILTALRQPRCVIDGLELRDDAVQAAGQNLSRMGLAGCVRQGDLRALPAQLWGQYDFCLCNPPYFDACGGQVSPQPSLAQARSDGAADIGAVCRCAFQALKTGGRLYLCFPAARLEALLCACRDNRLAAKRLRLVYNRPGQPAYLALLEGVKLGGQGLQLLPPLLLRDESGQYTAEYRQIYEGQA